MFEKSYFETLQDYIASGCTIELTGDELITIMRCMPWWG